MQLNRVGGQSGTPSIYISGKEALLERSAILSTPPLHSSWQIETRVEIDGKFLRVNGRRFWIKGVTYGTFAPNSEGEPYPEIDQVRRDFEQMRAAGINTVRLYTPPSNGLADAAAEAGLYI